MIIEVSLPIPARENFLYTVPSHLTDGIELGKRVFVPFKNRKAIGFVVGLNMKKPQFKLKDIEDVLDEYPLFDKKRLEFFNWVSRYYLTPLGLVLKYAHPLGLGKSLQKFVKLADPESEQKESRKLTPLENQLLKTVQLEKEITTERLLNSVEDSAFEDLNSLFRKKYIEFDYRVVSDEKVKYEKIYFTKASSEKVSELKDKKPAKGLILEFISAHPGVSRSELKELFGNLSPHVKWFEDKNIVQVEEKEISRDPFKNINSEMESPKKLTLDQKSAFEEINKSVNSKKHHAFLLHGITGSGKTEVYIQVIGKVIEKDMQALVLVPEISLTPLLVRRFKARFGDKVGVVHSQLSEGDRFDAWRRAHRGELKVIIGARSAVFAPLKKPGVVVVDEEHDSSYKQDEAPTYNARDMAVVLGKMYKCPVILGSATPSVESYYNARSDKYTYISLPTRIGESFLPEVDLVDMKNVKEKVFSPDLKDALIRNFEEKNQSILFLNRRGFSNLLVCEGCGELFNCPNCSVTLTYHKNDNSIKCHHCGINEKFENSCLNCESKFIALGIGTQKVEQEIRELIPEARVEIMDRDKVKGKTRLLNLYKRLENKEVDILIGTQMIAKGHDLPDVTLVGVISADQSLGMPDFRSGERTFQLITQVAGRAGRGKKPGRVIVQTFDPEHPGIKFAVEHDSLSFLDYETGLRKSLFFPPYTKLVNFKFGGKDEVVTKEFVQKSKDIAKKLRSRLSSDDIEIAGPSEAPLYRLQNRYRFQMLVKSDNLNSLHGFCGRLHSLLLKEKGSLRIRMDVDPYNFM